MKAIDGNKLIDGDDGVIYIFGEDSIEVEFSDSSLVRDDHPFLMARERDKGGEKE